MPLMTWTAKYSVGVKKFDEEHKHLFRMVNDLNDAMSEGKGKEILRQVLAGLATYTQYHFAAEEAALKQAGFAELAIHQSEHRALTEKVKNFMRDYERGDASVSVELLMFLRDWLDRHILGTDRRYTAQLNANRVS